MRLRVLLTLSEFALVSAVILQAIRSLVNISLAFPAASFRLSFSICPPYLPYMGGSLVQANVEELLHKHTPGQPGRFAQVATNVASTKTNEMMHIIGAMGDSSSEANRVLGQDQIMENSEGSLVARLWLAPRRLGD